MEAIATNAATARERLLHLIEDLINNVDDKKIIDIYASLSDEMEQDFVLSDELKAELDQIDDDLDNGRLDKFTTQEQFRNYVKEKTEK